MMNAVNEREHRAADYRGPNHLAGRDLGKVLATANRILSGEVKRGTVPPLWDGHAAERIANIIAAR